MMSALDQTSKHTATHEHKEGRFRVRLEFLVADALVPSE